MSLPETNLERGPSALALDNLKLWLVSHGHPYDRGVFAKESIKAFLLNYVILRPSYVSELVLSAGTSEHGICQVWLHFVTSLPFDSLEQSVQINELNRAFTHGVAIPLLPNPSVHTEFFVQDDLGDNSLYEVVQAMAKEDDLQYLGSVTFGKNQ